MLASLIEFLYAVDINEITENEGNRVHPKVMVKQNNSVKGVMIFGIGCRTGQ